MKKTLLLIVLLLFGVLTACNSPNNNTNNDNNSNNGSSNDNSNQTQTYTVTWKNHNGIVLETDYNVVKNSYPVYNGLTPSKPSDAQYTYVFDGWSPRLSLVTGNVTYTAQFLSVSKNKNITLNSSNFLTYFSVAMTYSKTSSGVNINVSISPKGTITDWSTASVTLNIKVEYSYKYPNGNTYNSFTNSPQTFNLYRLGTNGGARSIGIYQTASWTVSNVSYTISSAFGTITVIN
jgi:hypothetical protein